MSDATIAAVVDEAIVWWSGWLDLVLYDPRPRAEQIKGLVIPPAFAAWRAAFVASVPANQKALEKLTALHDQMHELARLVLMKTPLAQKPKAEDYASLSAKYAAFIGAARQMEAVFALAASGLDSLTGLRSRVGMFEELEREQSRFLRTSKGFCLAMMDIDHFKQVNDTYGHEAGDKVLSFVADHVSHALRAFDDAYRFGGEEFLLCLKEVLPQQGQKILQRLCESLSQREVLLRDGRTLRVTASFGMAASQEGSAIEALIRQADAALYRAKQDGRNRVVVA